MSIKYDQMTIRDAVGLINENKILLPAIQRKFVWGIPQVCQLFDSVLQGYPINTFMFWEVTCGDNKEGHKFYQFLKAYCQKFGEDNPLLKTHQNFSHFDAVIDGQQRLTSLYIGLCGTYAVKKARVWWPRFYDENLFPKRKLYLDLARELGAEDEESRVKYDFRFLTPSDVEGDKGRSLLCVHDVLNMKHYDDASDVHEEVVLPRLAAMGLSDNSFARKTLGRLYEMVHNKPVLHICRESDQSPEHVLDVFIRTNSGGTKLSYADLVMSIVVANWEGDFRGDVDGLTAHLRSGEDMGFHLDRDWILKVCLMLTDSDVKFKVKNFNRDCVRRIQQEWENIKKCIQATLRLVRDFGINEQALTSKNALIPICYYLYHKMVDGRKLYETVNNPIRARDHKAKIADWLYMALLRGMFGGRADATLTSMREVLRTHIGEGGFPLDSIVERYKGVNGDIRFDGEVVDRLLDIQYGDPRCRALLHLLFSDRDASEAYDIDHLHPQDGFGEKNLEVCAFLQGDEELLDFYREKGHWNSVANLHLLNKSVNRSKSDKSLEEWVAGDGKLAGDALVDGVSLKFEDFRSFYEARRGKLRKRLMSLVYLSGNEAVGENDGEEG